MRQGGMEGGREGGRERWREGEEGEDGGTEGESVSIHVEFETRFTLKSYIPLQRYFLFSAVVAILTQVLSQILSDHSLSQFQTPSHRQH